MKQSSLFTRTRKEAPADEVSKNAELLIRGGFINKEMAGVYDFLPLGFRVLNKIIGIIREEMNSLGAQEISMSALQRKELWERTNRWSSEKVDAWFKIDATEEARARLGTRADVMPQLSLWKEIEPHLGLGFTHEEPISNMLEQFVSSYKDLPFSVYQFQTKFRNETRAKSGILRTREFIMKDLYSFSKDSAQHQQFYNKVADAYRNIFKKVGIGHKTYFTRASGGSFSKFSHEFQTLCEAGEDTIYVSDDSDTAVNEEIINEKEAFENISVPRESFKQEKAVEVGNIFTLGTKFSDPYLKYTDEKGDSNLVFMGSYGIGPARLMGVIVETLSDDKGIIWPESVAPFQVHLLVLGEDDAVLEEAEKVYKELNKNGTEVLFDDRREVSAGEKFADADLLGIPMRVVVSKRSMEEKGVEVKKRTEEKGKFMPTKELLKILKV